MAVINRRDFIKQLGIISFGLSLPFVIDETITIVDIKVLDSIKNIIKIDLLKLLKNEMIGNVIINGNIYDYIKLIDDKDRMWHTYNEGKSWHCGLMSIDLELLDG